MLNSDFTVTVTTQRDRYRPRFYCFGHGGHGGHGVFIHTRVRARACENYLRPPLSFMYV